MPVFPGDPVAPVTETLPWVPAENLTCSPCDPNITAEMIAEAATTIADNLSGHRFGQRQLRLRPRTTNPTCGCRLGCGCGRTRAIILQENVTAITAIRIDGVDLGMDNWTLYNDGRLALTDDQEAGFPCCQRLERDPATDQGTLEIDCTVGAPPDAMAVLAVQEIACELVKVFDNPEACRLPKKVRSLTRQNITMNVNEDPSSVYLKGFVGLPAVDLWLAALDADSLRRGGRMVDLSLQNATRGAI